MTQTTLPLDPAPSATRYIPVSRALPTKFNEDGWSKAMLVCTDNRVNIYPHCYIKGKKGQPGYWLAVGQPHAVTNVTHWQEYPADPPALVIEVGS